MIRIIFLFVSLVSFSSHATFQCQNPPQFGQRTLKEEVVDYVLTIIGMTKSWCISENLKMTPMYHEDSSHVTYGDPYAGSSIGFPSYNFSGLSLQDGFMEACVASSRFRRMPIVTGTPLSTKKYLSYGPNQVVKKYIAYEGVPFVVKAHDRGWATKRISPSYYHWHFGDGSRSYPKDDDEHTVTHTYNGIGIYQLDSIVLTKFGELGISIGGSFGSDAFSWSSPVPYYKTSGVGIDSCDMAEVEVVKNDAPIASFLWGSSGYGKYVNLSFDGSSSSDPNGNALLSYEWDIDGMKMSGMKLPRVAFPRGDSIRYIDVTLTVSDGGKEGSVTRSVMVPPVCYSCNGSGKHEQ